MSHLINLQTAITMTSTFRTNKETILATAYRNQNILTICETFTRDAFDTLLGQDDCQGIRIYFGMDSNYKVNAVIVGIDSNGNDILKTGAEKIAEMGQRCPPYCPSASPLNS